MYREIRKKMVILSNRAPFTKEVASLVRYMQKRDWVYLNMKLEGSSITQIELEKILKTDSMVNIPIEDFLLIRRLEDLFGAMFKWAKQGLEISSEMIDAMYNICTQQEPEYRRSTPTIMHWSFTPAIHSQIPEKIKEFIKHTKKSSFDPMEKAVDLHNEFLQICPYDKFNEVIARAIMYYYLLHSNLPLADLHIKEEEYNSILFEELNKGWEKSGLYDYLAKGTLLTLQVIDNLTKDNR